jgi:hypothetical protein
VGLIIIAATPTDGAGDLVVGLLIGLCIGFLVGPAVRSWLTHREWVEASRQALLAERVLARMEVDAALERSDATLEPSDAPAEEHRIEEPTRPWRTLP